MTNPKNRSLCPPAPMNAMKRSLLRLAAFLVTIPMMAQQDATPAGQTPPEIKFSIVRQIRFDLGDHQLILNRVAPPVLQTAPVSKQQEAAELAPADLAKIAKARKPSEVLFLSATVHDHKFSEIRWMEGGHQRTAFSNVDFNLLGALGTVETVDTIYSPLMAIGNVTTGADGAPRRNDVGGDKASAKGRQIPSLEKLSQTNAQYWIVEDNSGAAPSAKVLAALDALHLYYDANRQQLSEAHARRQAANAEHERWLKEHPPIPKDTVIHYWKMDAKSIRKATEELRK